MFEAGEVKYVILRLLKEKPRHGYEIITALEARRGGWWAGDLHEALHGMRHELRDFGRIFDHHFRHHRRGDRIDPQKLHRIREVVLRAKREIEGILAEETV